MKRFFIVTLILIVSLNSIALSIFFVVHSHDSFRQIRSRDIEDIQRQVVERIESFHVLIQPLEEQARIYNEEILRSMYGELEAMSPDGVFQVENELLEEVAAEYEHVDIYLVNDRGVVEKSSFESDRGLDLFDLSETFTQFLLEIYGTGELFTQRLSISNMKGTKFIYSYFSPEGSDWIFEISLDFAGFIREHYSKELYRYLFDEFFTEIERVNSELVGFDIFYRTSVSTRSLLSGEAVDVDTEKIDALEANEVFESRGADVLSFYIKRSMKRSGFAYVQYPIIYLEYDLSTYYDFLRRFYLINGAAILLLLIFFSLVAYQLIEVKLVRRIDELDGILQEAASGSYEYRVQYETRIPELMTLALSANVLIDGVKSREEELRRSVQERETLIDEVHHRVKNNLNVVISLLNLQRDQVESVGEVQEALEKTRNRIYSIALTHEKLYHSENLTDVNMRSYIETFVAGFKGTYPESSRIEFHLEAEDLDLSIVYAVPCGIILNELMSNAVEHAFSEGARNKERITIALFRGREGLYHLVVEDNGKGLPEGSRQGAVNSLGLTLVDSLVTQIRGELHAENGEEGARFELVFPV